MSRFIRFSEYFKKVLGEDATAGSAGVGGDGSGFSPDNSTSSDSYAPGDARNIFGSGKKVKVQKRINKKKKSKVRIPSENEESTITHVTNGKVTHKFDSVEKALTMYDSLGGAAAGWKVVTPKEEDEEGKIANRVVKGTVRVAGGAAKQAGKAAYKAANGITAGVLQQHVDDAKKVIKGVKDTAKFVKDAYSGEDEEQDHTFECECGEKWQTKEGKDSCKECNG
jgi:hypothetical protein